MSKDKIYGYGIFIVTLVLLVGFLGMTLVNYYLLASGDSTAKAHTPFLGLTPFEAVMWPVFFAVVMVGLIIAWIGLTMATTPPPEPIDLDELDLDDDDDDDDDDD